MRKDEMDINLEQQSLEMCLKQINNIGSTTYQNIFTGESTTVLWGNSNWIGVVMLSLFVLAVVFFVISVGFMLIKMSQDL